MAGRDVQHFAFGAGTASSWSAAGRYGVRRRGRRFSPLWPVLLIGGVTLAVVLSRSRAVRAVAARWFAPRTNRMTAARDHVQALRDSIIGVSKQTVAAALGAPPASAGRSGFRESDTWYYPLDPVERLALAIRFDSNDLARSTELLRTPTRATPKPATG